MPFVSWYVCVRFFQRQISSKPLMSTQICFFWCLSETGIRWDVLAVVSVGLVEGLFLINGKLFSLPALGCCLSKDLAALAASLIILDIR